MIQNLDDILGKLGSDEAKLAALQLIYEPGKTDIALRIYEFESKKVEHFDDQMPNNSILSFEIDFYQRENLTSDDCFVNLGEVAIRHSYDYQDSTFDFRSINEWNNLTLAKYTIKLLSQRIGNYELIDIKKDDYESYDKIWNDKWREEKVLADAIKICDHFNIDDGRENLQRRRANLMLNRDRFTGDFTHSIDIVNILNEIGKYDESINLRLEQTKINKHGGYRYFSNALELAKKHNPDRVEAIAQLGYDSFESNLRDWNTYLECGREIGKEKEAKENVIQLTINGKTSNLARNYTPLVEELIRDGNKDRARDLIEAVKTNKRNTYPDFEVEVQMADLYLLVGDKDNAGNMIKNTQVPTDPDYALQFYDHAHRITGDQSYLERQIPHLESEGKFEDAAVLAKRFKRQELLEVYGYLDRNKTEFQY